MRTKAAPFALLPLAGLAVLWISCRPRTAPASGSEATIAPQGAALEAEGPGHASIPAESRSPVVNGDANKPGRPQVVLIGTLTGFEAAPDSTMRISILPEGGVAEPIVRTLPARSSFEIDLGGDFPVPTPPLIVWIEHADHFPTLARVEANSGADGATRRIELRTSFKMVRASSIVTGRAVLPESTRPDRAWAALYSIQPSSARALRLADEVRLDAQGRFRLHAEREGDNVLAVVHPDLEPRTDRLTLLARGSRDLGDLPLSEGSRITGRVALPGGQQGARWSVSAVLAEPGIPCLVGEISLRWTASGFEHGNRLASADVEGRFEIPGLARNRYRLSACPEWWSAQPALVIADSVEQPIEVLAPAEGVDLTIDRLMVLLEIRGAGTPLADAQVEVRSDKVRGVESAKSGGNGRLALDIRRTERFELRIEKTGFLPATLPIAPSELRNEQGLQVDLEQGPRLSKVVLDAPGLSLQWACVVLIAVEKIEANSLASLRLGEPFLARPRDKIVTAAPQPDGSFATDEIESGRYWVQILPCEGIGKNPTFYVLAGFEIDVPPGTVFHQALRLEEGGRIRIEPGEYAGSTDLASSSLTAQDRSSVGVYWTPVRRVSSGTDYGSCSGSLPLRAPCESTNVRPGTYRIWIGGQDFVPQEIPVSVEAGRTTTVRLDLRRP